MTAGVGSGMVVDVANVPSDPHRVRLVEGWAPTSHYWGWTDLSPYLNVTVERGTGGSSSSCTGFTPDATLSTGTLANFAGTADDYANGLGNWGPAASPASHTYRFSVSVAEDDASQGRNADAAFIWRVQTG